MSQISKKSMVRYVVWGVSVCVVTSVLVSIPLWRSLFNSLPVDQMVSEFEQKTGLSVTFHETQYDIWQGVLTLDDVTVAADNGVRIQSDTVTVNIPVMRYLRNQPLLAGEEWRFDQGSVRYRQLSLLFSQLSADLNQGTDIDFIFHGQEDKGANWQFRGQWQVSQRSLKGSLAIENQPFNRFSQFWHALSDSDQGNVVHAQCKVSGEFSVTGQLDSGFMLKGDAALSEGSLVLPDGKISWQEATLSHLTFNSQNASWQADNLNIADAVVNSSRPERLLLSQNTLPLTFNSLSMMNGTMFSSALGSSKLPFSLNVSVDKDLIHYTINNIELRADEGKKLSLTGGVTRHNTQEVPFLVQFSGVSLPTKDKEVPVLAGADVSGSVISGKVDGAFFLSGNIKADGSIQFDKLMYQLGEADKGKPWVNRLMSDGQSPLQTEFSVSDEAGSFRKAVLMSVDQKWQPVVDKPFEYLSTIHGIDAPLTPEICFEKGSEQIASESRKNLEMLAKALMVRPALKIKVNGYAGRKTDGHALAKKEIEADLLSVYRAIHGDKVTTVPVSERSVLLEQMYLRLQGKKLPDVGTKNSKERAEDAEQWLIEHWPGDHEVTLSGLAAKRSEQIQSLLLQYGISQDRISIISKGVGAATQSFIELE
ncbi:hypothetical protein CI610_00301 [invertebrate metagenome]|uniref:OmpA-like domain-containing protein n=1 Tax=invertebrate metagenome TaxID=1711999 RepID=A0A2H9TBX2_9ZZZZ